MTLKSDFFRYLDHFKGAVPLRELHARPALADGVGLRHDIDHDLDLALEVAHHEHALGIRATYFLLHTHRYWTDPRLLLKCRQLQEYGHEVGLHLNLLSEWNEGQCDDPAESLRAILDHLRSGGIDVVGVSAHGDKACYRHQFINYWLFGELRGDDPAESERGRSPEGIVVADPERQIVYPINHRLQRIDGMELPLWSVSMADQGLLYDAAHLPVDQYWTDTGGAWTRSGDPLQADLSRGRHQVLMHPWWWRGPSKCVFVLSAARSGSTWLANFVDRATSCRGFHEWTLNHRRKDNKFIPEKHTGGDYVGLIENHKLIATLIRTTRAYFRLQNRDVLEANVYLEPMVEPLRKAMPEAVRVHLHRNGRDVVRSILNRSWYDTPLDRRHRAVPVPEWDRLNQFQRACWYYRFTNERLADSTSQRLSFERLVSEQEYLISRLGDLGIVVHPLLAREEFGKRLNVAATDEIPPYDQWPSRLQLDFEAICGEVQRLLGYDAGLSSGSALETSRRRAIRSSRRVLHLRFAGAGVNGFFSRGLDLDRRRDGLGLIQTGGAAGAAYLLLARGRWHQLLPDQGLSCASGEAFSGDLSANTPAGPFVRLFVVFYDESAKQVSKQQLGVLGPERELLQFAFSAPAGAARMALAIHMADAAPGATILVKNLKLMRHRLDKQYRIAAVFSPART